MENKMTNKEKLIYMAGIVDGEGHFWRGNSKNGRGEDYTISRIHVTNTNTDLIDWIKTNFGGYAYLKKGGRPRHWLDCYTWSLAGKKAEALALELQPYLIVKKEQVLRVLGGSKT